MSIDSEGVHRESRGGKFDFDRQSFLKEARLEAIRLRIGTNLERDYLAVTICLDWEFKQLEGDRNINEFH